MFPVRDSSSFALFFGQKVFFAHLSWTELFHFNFFRACLHGGGGPQVGEVTRLGGVTRLSI